MARLLVKRGTQQLERFYLEWNNKSIKCLGDEVCETEGRLENKDANLIETAKNCLK